MNLYDAHNNWAVRPADERFPSLSALRNFLVARNVDSSDQVRDIRSSEFHCTNNNLGIFVDGTSATFTNWGFGQVSSALKVPRTFVGSLSPEVAATCLNDVVARNNGLTGPKNLLFRSDKIASVMGPNYGRVWDISVLDEIIESTKESPWHVPPARNSMGSDCSGLYASDRDMFVFMVNEDEKIEVGNALLSKGFFIWNSEVGDRSLGITTFLYNYVCGNHIVWGAEEVNELRIVHRRNAQERFSHEFLVALRQYTENKQLTDRIKDFVYATQKDRLLEGPEDLLNESLTKIFSESELKGAWNYSIDEGDDPQTKWGLVQGLTAFARQKTYAADRVDLERRAGALLVA